MAFYDSRFVGRFPAKKEWCVPCGIRTLRSVPAPASRILGETLGRTRHYLIFNLGA